MADGSNPLPRSSACRPVPLTATASAAPIILTALMDAADLGWLDAQRRAHFPPDRNVLTAHLTLFHHLPPGRIAELERLVASLCRDRAPEARIDRLMSLGRGVAYGVDSPDLLDMRALVAEHFAADLIPQDRQRPRMHVTIQNKVAPAVARALHDQLAADFRPRPLRIVGIGGWHYRGGPWEPAFARRFAHGPARR